MKTSILVPTPARLLTLACALAFVPATSGNAGNTGKNPGAFETSAARPSRDEIRAAMEKATRFMLSISTEGGYLYNYSPDLSIRAGEKFATPTQIWVQPPGTPAMGRAFLNAYAATENPLYLEAAQRAAHALARCQLPSGGWDYMGDFDPKWPNKDGLRSYQGAQSSGGKHPGNPHYFLATSFDDNVTQSAIRFLMEYAEAAGISSFLKNAKNIANPKDRAIAASLTRALECVLKAQYPNGAWPQRHDGKPRNAATHPAIAASYPESHPREWPGFRNYTEYYTFNDGCIRDCIYIMLDAWKRYNAPAFLESARKGADFILLAQMPEPQPGWAQQYDFRMHPAWARGGEPPGIASNETRVALEALLAFYLETGEEKYFKPIAPAIAWLRRSTVKPNLWARIYEMKTNRPIYGKVNSKGGKIAHDMEHAPETYGWQSDFQIPRFIARYEKLKSAGRDAYLKQTPALSESGNCAPPDVAKIHGILAQLDDQGRWLSEGRFRKNTPREHMISTREYIKNMNVLCAYITRTAASFPHE